MTITKEQVLVPREMLEAAVDLAQRIVYHPVIRPQSRTIELLGKLRTLLNAASESAVSEPAQKMVMPYITQEHFDRAFPKSAESEPVKLWCETCEGKGTVDNTLGGDNINATDHDPCPDCDGSGGFISSVYRAAPPAEAKREPQDWTHAAREKAGYEEGWNDCMKLWADHMKRMNAALGNAPIHSYKVKSLNIGAKEQ